MNASRMESTVERTVNVQTVRILNREVLEIEMNLNWIFYHLSLETTFKTKIRVQSVRGHTMRRRIKR